MKLMIVIIDFEIPPAREAVRAEGLRDTIGHLSVSDASPNSCAPCVFGTSTIGNGCLQ